MKGDKNIARTEAQKRANAKYDKKTYKVFTVKLRKDEDADIIALTEKESIRNLLIKAYRK